MLHTARGTQHNLVDDFLDLGLLLETEPILKVYPFAHNRPNRIQILLSRSPFLFFKRWQHILENFVTDFNSVVQVWKTTYPLGLFLIQHLLNFLLVHVLLYWQVVLIVFWKLSQHVFYDAEFLGKFFVGLTFKQVSMCRGLIDDFFSHLHASVLKLYHEIRKHFRPVSVDIVVFPMLPKLSCDPIGDVGNRPEVNQVVFDAPYFFAEDSTETQFSPTSPLLVTVN